MADQIIINDFSTDPSRLIGAFESVNGILNAQTIVKDYYTAVGSGLPAEVTVIQSGNYPLSGVMTIISASGADLPAMIATSGGLTVGCQYDINEILTGVSGLIQQMVVDAMLKVNIYQVRDQEVTSIDDFKATEASGFPTKEEIADQVDTKLTQEHGTGAWNATPSGTSPAPSGYNTVMKVQVL